VLDFEVNLGPYTSAMQLQGPLNVKQNGVIGPVTLEALRAHDGSWDRADGAVRGGSYGDSTEAVRLLANLIPSIQSMSRPRLGQL
jgi:hypothetical protein